MAINTTALRDNVGNEIYKGAAYIRSYQITDNGTPVDITGATGVCKINRGSTLLFSPTFSIVDAATGKFRIALTAVQTATQSPVIPATVMAVSGADFETKEKYELLSMFINLTLGGTVYQVVKGYPKFFDSPNA